MPCNFFYIRDEGDEDDILRRRHILIICVGAPAALQVCSRPEACRAVPQRA